MDIKQSYLSTIMRGDFSIIEIRLFMSIVNQANVILKHVKMRNVVGAAMCSDGVNCNFIVPLRDVMGESTHNYDRVKAAVRSLNKKQVEAYDPRKKTWYLTSFINNVAIRDNESVLQLTVSRWLLDYIMDFVAGYSKYSVEAAMRMPSPNYVRLYWMFGSQKSPMDLSIEFLRKWLGAETTYKQTRDFVKRCIAPAMSYLEKNELNGFLYSPIKQHGKIIALRFSPVQRENHIEQLAARVPLSSLINPALRQFLMSAGFTYKGLSCHKELLRNFSKLPNWSDKISKIVERQQTKGKRLGYIIGAMRKEVEEADIGK